MFAGTLNAFLRAHPSIAGAEKEMNFFSRGYTKGLEYYLDAMKPSYPWQITLEKSTSYFTTNTTVLERIYKFNKDIKMILIVTDPVLRLQSDYMHSRVNVISKRPGYGRQQEGTHSFQELVFHKGTHTVNRRYKRVKESLYYMAMEAFLKYFKRNKLLILDGERFKRDPLYGLKQCEQFLEIPPYFNENHLFFNATKGFWCLRAFGCMGSNKGRVHPVLSEPALTALYKYYQEPNKKFGNLAGIDFNWLSSVPIHSSSNKTRTLT